MANRAIGILCDYWTGQPLRQATPSELETAELDGGRGVITVDGRACYAYFTASLTVPVARRASTHNPDHDRVAPRVAPRVAA